MRVPSVPSVSQLLLLLAVVGLVGCLNLPGVSKIGQTDASRRARGIKFPSLNVTKDAVKNLAGSATDAVKDAANSAKDGVSTVVNSTKNVAVEAANITKEGVTTAVNSTKNVAVEVANITKEGVNTAVDTTKDGVKIAVNTTKDGVNVLVNATKEVVNPEDVCYPGLDCFSMSSPWYSILRPLPKPQSPDTIDAQFYLYTRGYPGRFTVTWRFRNDSKTDADADDDGGMTLSGSDYDGSRKTFFITHGFASNANSSWLSDMKDALLKRFDCNVFLVDWGKGASLLNYFQVAANTRVVAAVLSKLGHLLVDRHNADPSRMHAIGHSLGAQISAYFAKNMTTLGRLTALDPAQPAFEHYDRRVRLDISDAALVDVVHTSARPFLPFAGLGMVNSYGHIDFYMNGGWKQPGCYWPENVNITKFLELAKLPVEVLSNLISCPHGRSYEYFTASLGINKTFWGHRINSFTTFLSTLTAGYGAKLIIPDDEDCNAESCSPFGYDAFDYPARGKFGVATTDGFPYVVPEPRVDAHMRQYRGLRPSKEPVEPDVEPEAGTESIPHDIVIDDEVPKSCNA